MSIEHGTFQSRKLLAELSSKGKLQEGAITRVDTKHCIEGMVVESRHVCLKRPRVKSDDSDEAFPIGIPFATWHKTLIVFELAFAFTA
jgi:hypothetical protein